MKKSWISRISLRLIIILGFKKRLVFRFKGIFDLWKVLLGRK